MIITFLKKKQDKKYSVQLMKDPSLPQRRDKARREGWVEKGA